MRLRTRPSARPRSPELRCSRAPALHAPAARRGSAGGSGAGGGEGMELGRHLAITGEK
jgi:hypothetical protein